MGKKSQEQYIEDAKGVHKDRYDYSKVEYCGNKIPIIIVCKIHGEFSQVPVTHLQGANCYKCGKEAMASRCRRSKEEFIITSNIKHNNYYDYSKVVYKNNRTKIIITCPVHGDFEKTPCKHLEGAGCMKCLYEVRTKTTEQFVKEVSIIHDNFYTYKETIYTHSGNKVIITCPEHGNFLQRAKAHREGNGCPSCSKEMNNFRRSHYVSLSEDSTLYLIRAYNDEEEFYKIGKTIYKVKQRFSKGSIPYNYEILHELKLEIGEIYDLEIELHKKYKSFQYTPKVNFCGCTECYTLELPSNEIINL